jgi:hypothetical protein
MRLELQTWPAQIWRTEAGSRLWLSTLIAAMEDAALPEVRRQSIAPSTLALLQAQLALSGSVRRCPTTASSLRH